MLLCVRLSGYHPFDVYGELPEPQLLRKIMDCSYDFDDDVWNHVSDEAKNLIRGLLKLEPSHRISLDTFLSSPWIKGEGVNDRELPMVVTRLEKLNKGRRKFRVRHTSLHRSAAPLHPITSTVRTRLCDKCETKPPALHFTIASNTNHQARSVSDTVRRSLQSIDTPRRGSHNSFAATQPILGPSPSPHD